MVAISRRLLFRIGTIGFFLDLNELVEIREQVSDQIVLSPTDLPMFVLGSLPFRGSMIPVFDLSARLKLQPGLSDIALVLNGPNGNWALLIDRVEGIYPQAEIVAQEIPALLLDNGWRCFTRLALYNKSPFLQLDLSSCYPVGRQ